MKIEFVKKYFRFNSRNLHPSREKTTAIQYTRGPRHTLAQEVACGSWPNRRSRGGAESLHAHLHSLERNFFGISNALDRLKYVFKYVETCPQLLELRPQPKKKKLKCI